MAGHEAVAVLDGGLQAWTQAGGALAQRPRRHGTLGPFSPVPTAPAGHHGEACRWDTAEGLRRRPGAATTGEVEADPGGRASQAR